MRIKREHLLITARNLVTERTRYNRRVVSVYLTGSLLKDDFLLGGSGDIDLIFVHDEPIEVGREIVAVNEDVHFDIANLPLRIFQQPRSLRIDPWIGPFFCLNPICLHDTQHWFEFTQASLCSQFNRPENILQRARSQAEVARQSWMSLNSSSPWNSEKVLVYLSSIEKAANAIALVSGAPLTERRFMLQFAQRAAAIQHPGMATGLLDLITPGEQLPATTLSDWLPSWNHALTKCSQLSNPPQRLTACRLSYYTKAAEALVNDFPGAALWILLRTWTLAVNNLTADSKIVAAWKQSLQTLHLDVEHAEERLDALDSYLDTVEEILDTQAKNQGV
jgi:hypothetical protein